MTETATPRRPVRTRRRGPSITRVLTEAAKSGLQVARAIAREDRGVEIVFAPPGAEPPTSTTNPWDRVLPDGPR
jgi:hypothetical protein